MRCVLVVFRVLIEEQFTLHKIMYSLNRIKSHCVVKLCSGLIFLVFPS